MADVKKTKYDAPYLDKEERETMEAFDAAIDAGEIVPHTAEEIETARQDWKGVLDNTYR